MLDLTCCSEGQQWYKVEFTTTRSRDSESLTNESKVTQLVSGGAGIVIHATEFEASGLPLPAMRSEEPEFRPQLCPLLARDHNNAPRLRLR